MILFGTIPGLDVYRNNGCSRCGRDDRLVDLDWSVDFEGAVAMCVGCVTDAAGAAGLDPQGTELLEARAAVEALETELAVLRDRLARIRSAVTSKGGSR